MSAATGFRLDNKNAIVTGGGSGIGAAIARRFAANGASVAIVDLDLVAAQTVTEDIRKSGGDAHPYACDVSDSANVDRVFAEILQSGRLHILANIAGIAHIGKLDTTSEADLDRVYRVNVKGMYNCMRACVAHMKANGGGVILNMASIAGTSGIPDRFAYSMSKGAVIAMTLSVARDYLADNIRCNCISPARVHTPFVDGFLAKNYPGREQDMFDKLSKTQPIGRMAQPDEVAAMAQFLCSDQAAFITGMDYPVDGGFLNLRG